MEQTEKPHWKQGGNQQLNTSRKHLSPQAWEEREKKGLMKPRSQSHLTDTGTSVVLSNGSWSQGREVVAAGESIIAYSMGEKYPDSLCFLPSSIPTMPPIGCQEPGIHSLQDSLLLQYRAVKKN